MAAAPMWPVAVLVVWTSYLHHLLLPSVQAVWLNLPSSGTKCLSEYIESDAVVLANYGVVVIDDTHPAISVKVTSPYGDNLHHQENVSHGHFATITKESGNYVACFWMDSKLQDSKAKGATVSFEWTIGVSAKDWEAVGRKGKTEGVKLELRKRG